MNRRDIFKGIIGAAVASAVPSMPFVWREWTYRELKMQVLVGTSAAEESSEKQSAFVAQLRSRIEEIRADMQAQVEGRVFS